MTLKAALIVPHPPIIVPEIGAGYLGEVEATVGAMRRLASDTKELGVTTLAAVSPHSPLLYDSFLIKTGSRLTGTFSPFNHPELAFAIEGDTGLATALATASRRADLPVTTLAVGDAAAETELDHGVLVPYYYLRQEREYRLVSASIAGLSLSEHFAFGQVLGNVCADYEAPTAYLASGDLSHRLKPGAPAGYSPRGVDFDREIKEIVAAGEFNRLLELSPDLITAAGECGLRSLVILAGLLDGRSYQTEVLSYEGPFGVGYLVAEVKLSA